MVLRHFKLREQPFGVTPDPRFLYASGTHREALSSLLYGIESGLGFVSMIADPGMGKTTLLFETLRRLEGNTRTVFLFQTVATPLDLVRALLIDLGAQELAGTMVELQTQLNEILVKQAATGQRLVVVIDEAQNLDESVLEAVRMLSNFETARQKLMQIILSGQLQLGDKLALPQLVQLRQRISILAQLKPLSEQETGAYIHHRLQVAGSSTEEPVFQSSAVNLIARHSGGIPRNINNICFNALSLACALDRKTIDAEVVREVLSDLDIQWAVTSTNRAVPEDKAIRPVGKVKKAGVPRIFRTRVLAISAIATLVVGLFGWLILQDYRALSAEKTVQANVRPETAAPAVAAQPSTVDPAVEAFSEPSTIPTTVPTIPGGTTGAGSISGQASGQDALSGASSRAVSGSRSKPRRTAHKDLAPAPQKSLNPAVDSPSGTRTLEVRDGQSLFSICEQTFGECKPDVLKQIIKMNPSISNPDHIEIGERVALPSLPTSSVPNP